MGLETSHLKIATGVTSLESREPARATPIEGRRLLDHREDSAEEPTPEHGTGGSAHRQIARGVTGPTDLLYTCVFRVLAAYPVLLEAPLPFAA
jgi:hypothetical protein